MHFRFCGGLEPPDWILAEIGLINRLSIEQVTSVTTAISANIAHSDHVAQTEEVTAVYSEQDQARALVKVLQFLIGQAAKYDVNARELVVELLQLGVAKETSDAIAQVYERERLQVRQQLQRQSFKFPHVTKLKFAIPPKREDGSEHVELVLQLNTSLQECATSTATASKLPSDSLSISMTHDKFLALYEELSQAQAILQAMPR
ncbi:hypothetical protein Poli38472_003732 [Pythium oligandrum]|uniref:COMM domain-containing protein n=1 Tax=Pythium oligandrum TaxID=41045 RepID=A0A8K1CP20_PYTOL|nr:hypothetical protein Poli38472_003732 [Pythium oligandrum]|eukprot:TMW65967.1 hypothetical protein Poli38472_003732 [Pythium oligandrum]